MKRAFCLVVCLLLLVTSVQAATVKTTKGTNNVLFQFNGLSNLGVKGFDTGFGTSDVISNLESALPGENPFTGITETGAGIGFRHYINDGLAIRPGVDFGIASGEVKDPDNSANKTKTTLTDIGLSLALEKHRDMTGSISPYLGGGAGFQISKREVKTTVGGATDTNKLSASAFSVFALLGFEWAFADAVTLGGEYRAGVAVGSGNVKSNGHKTADVSTTAGGISTASLFLSIGW